MKNNAKRILSFMLAVLLCVCMIVVPAAAADVECEEHVKGEVYDTVESVCGNYGYTIYVCSVCQDYFAADLVKPTGTHTAGDLVAEGVDATCTADGKEAAYKCTTCDAICDVNGGTVDVIPELDGDHDKGENEPKKVVDGVEYYDCVKCGAEFTIVVACPEGTHVWSDAPTSITVNEKTADGVIGTAVYTCKNCPVTKEVDVIWNHLHTENLKHFEAVVPEHCEAEGNIEYWECTFCGLKFLDAAATKVVENVENNGKHTYDVKPTIVEPTCTTYGFKFYACTVCGEQDVERTETLKPLGHKAPATATDVKEPTCTQDGYTGNYNCTVCGTKVEGEVIPALGHKEVTVTIAATCSSYSYTFVYCANGAKCDGTAFGNVSLKVVGGANGIEIYDFKYDAEGNAIYFEHDGGTSTRVKNDSFVVDYAAGFDATNHAYEKIVVQEPTCTEDGSYYELCKACKTYKTDATGEKVKVRIPATGHNIDTTIAANVTIINPAANNCTTAIKANVVCANGCGHVEKNVVIKASTGHDTSKATLQTVPTTCQKAGYTYKICANCGEEVVVDKLPAFVFDVTHHYVTEEDAKKDHVNIVKVGTDLEGSCESVGLYRYQCTDCGKHFLVIIAGTGEGHVAKDYIVDPVAPTCTTKGSTGKYVCTVCGKTIESDEIPALGHSWKDIAAKAPTCTAAGNEAGKECTVCGVVEGAKEIPALGHNWVVGENGEYVCDREGCDSVCDHANAVLADNRTADCTLYGYAHYVCSCGYEYVTDYVDALGHTPDEGTTTAPTCTKEGSTVYVCTVCGKTTETDVIPPTGHKNAAGETIVESCTDKVEDRVCVNKNCDDADKVIGTDCTNTVTTFVDATCSEYGYVLVVCLDCGEYTMTIDDTKEPLTHKYTIFVETLIPATPTTKGQAVYACEHCGEDTILDVDFAGTSFDVTFENTLAAKVEADKVAGNLSEDLVIDKKVVNGSEIKVTITLNTEAIELWGLELDIRYATQYLTFKGAEIGEVFADTAVFGTTIVDNGNGWLALLATANNSADPEHGGVQNQTVEGAVVVVDLYFDVTDKAAGKNVELTFDAAAYDKDAKVVAAQTGAATIEVATLYDVTHDGAINMADLNAMMKMYTGESNVYCTAADINRNGVIDVEDIQAMMLYVLKH